MVKFTCAQPDGSASHSMSDKSAQLAGWQRARRHLTAGSQTRQPAQQRQPRPGDSAARAAGGSGAHHFGLGGGQTGPSWRDWEWGRKTRGHMGPRQEAAFSGPREPAEYGFQITSS